MVDKEIRKGFKKIRASIPKEKEIPKEYRQFYFAQFKPIKATITKQEKEILKADIKADQERARLKRKLEKA